MIMMKKKVLKLRSAEAEELSRLLTLERLKHAGVLTLVAAADDEDLKPLVAAVRKVSQKKKAKGSPFTPQDLKKLAGF